MDMVNQVIEFNAKVLGIPDRKKEALCSKEFDLAVVQMKEEITEFIDAHETGNYIGQVDALCDLVYFAIGKLYAMGLSADDIKNIFTLVHEANMQKKRGVKKERGDFGAADAFKPEDWVSPEDRIIEYLSKVDGVSLDGSDMPDCNCTPGQCHVCVDK